MTRRYFLGLVCSIASILGFKPKPKPPVDGILGDCVVTCPVCKTQTQEMMPSEAIKLIYHCPGCLTWLSPKEGDHCIYDSYGSVNCPPIQVKICQASGLPIPKMITKRKAPK